jgi:hypothetical protein
MLLIVILLGILELQKPDFWDSERLMDPDFLEGFS